APYARQRSSEGLDRGYAARRGSYVFGFNLDPYEKTILVVTPPVIPPPTPVPPYIPSTSQATPSAQTVPPTKPTPRNHFPEFHYPAPSTRDHPSQTHHLSLSHSHLPPQP
ncbi:hypothetical protein Salat_1152500, partial [Sesamum alatum]